MSLSFARRGANAPASAPILVLDLKTKKRKMDRGQNINRRLWRQGGKSWTYLQRPGNDVSAILPAKASAPYLATLLDYIFRLKAEGYQSQPGPYPDLAPRQAFQPKSPQTQLYIQTALATPKWKNDTDMVIRLSPGLNPNPKTQRACLGTFACPQSCIVLQSHVTAALLTHTATSGTMGTNCHT